MNRVVVTGYGVVSPVGNDIPTFWDALRSGQSGIGPITKFDAEPTGISLAAEVKDFSFTTENTEMKEKLSHRFEKKDFKRMDLFSLYGIYAAVDALEMSQFDINESNEDRVGVIVGSGIGGLKTIQEQVIKMHDRGPQRVSPLFVPMSITNMAAANIAMKVGAKGICTSIVTACASATHSIGEAFRNIKHGYSDVILAGGAEASITEIGIAGFSALTALTNETDKDRASIPFDKKRNGFVMGEGAGVIVLESYEHAKKRGATILGEVVGYGANCDAYHITSPLPDGSGAAKAMKLAMSEADITPDEVGYINAHGTSTPANDAGECLAIHKALGGSADNVLVSSTKSMTGHLLGAAGAIEAIATLKALEDQFVPPTIGVIEQDEACNVDIVKDTGKPITSNYALSNSLGFGGHNAVICLKRWES